jgi:hypothetical protein
MLYTMLGYILQNIWHLYYYTDYYTSKSAKNFNYTVIKDNETHFRY